MAERVYILTASQEAHEACWSITSPDFPEIASVAEHEGDLPRQVRDALDTAVAARLEDGEGLPGQTLQFPATGLGFAGRVAHFVLPVDVQDEPVRVNISLDSHLLKRIDREAARRGMTRSGFLAEGVKRLMQ
jgi:predicted RNase H-like HicB family nuclease